MASATSPDNNHIAELGPSSGHVPNKLVADEFTFQFNTYMLPLDVTSGKWLQFPFFQRYTSDNMGKITNTKCFTLPEVSMEQVIGKANLQMLGGDDMSGDITKSDWTLDNTLYGEYLWGRLKSVELHAKNMLVTVERDSSGGVQWKDEPIFEVMAIPITKFGTPDASGTIQYDPDCPPRTYTTTLKEGIRTIQTFDCGLFFRPSTVAEWGLVGADHYIHYPTLGQWILQAYPSGLETSFENIDPYVRINNCFYCYFIRCINIPRGLSNIKVSLSYSCEMKSSWHLDGRRITTQDVRSWFPPEGARLTVTRDANGQKIKKRKLGSITDILTGN